jgi:hypothetical protein
MQGILEAEAAASDDDDTNVQEEQSQGISKALQCPSSSQPSRAAATAFDPDGPKRQKTCSDNDEEKECDKRKGEDRESKRLQCGWRW